MFFHKPKVSIIVPCYNVEKYLPRCISALLGQTYRNIEILCFDDGSTDGTRTILERFEKDDPRIRAFTGPNRGVGKARQSGLSRATGEFVMFCDADDWYDRSCVARMVRAMRWHKVDMAVCGSNVVDPRGLSLQRRKESKDYYEGNKFRGRHRIGEQVIFDINKILWNKIFRADIIRRNGLRFGSFVCGEDVAFVTEYMMVSGSVYFINRKLYNYTRRNNSIMGELYNAKRTNIGDHLKPVLHMRNFIKRRGLSEYGHFIKKIYVEEVRNVLWWMNFVSGHKFAMLKKKARKNRKYAKRR